MEKNDNKIVIECHYCKAPSCCKALKRNLNVDILKIHTLICNTQGVQNED